jgi:hypothetical protein
MIATLDGALLHFDEADVGSETDVVISKLSAIHLHREFIREYEVRLATTNEFVAEVMGRFPWNEGPRNPTFREAFMLVTEELTRAEYLTPKQLVALDGPLDPCREVPDPMKAAWEEVVGATTELAAESGDSSFGIGTLEGACEDPFRCVARTDALSLPAATLMDRATWYRWMDEWEWWPDLRRAVEVAFWSDAGLNQHESALAEPMPYDWTAEFQVALESSPTVAMRRNAIRAICKRVHNVIDDALGNETFGSGWRMRVTLKWRIHYEIRGGRLIFTQFGGHSIGGVN